jgi:hypothetical protein
MGVMKKELGSLVELAHNWHTIKFLHGNTRSQLEIGAIRDKDIRNKTICSMEKDLLRYKERCNKEFTV